MAIVFSLNREVMFPFMFFNWYLHLMDSFEHMLKTIETGCMCMSGQADTTEDGDRKIINFCLYAEIWNTRNKNPNIGAIRHDYEPGTPTSDPGSLLRRIRHLHHNHPDRGQQD